jgi:regulatory protein
VARSTPEPSQLTTRAAVTAGLLMLGRRELSSRQIADRLRRKGFPHDVIEPALASLRESGALNDARAAAARARHDVTIRRHGRSRVLRQVKALGVSDETAKHAVSAAFSDVSEDQMLATALARKLRGAEPPSDPKAVRRLQGWLLRQGFEPDKVQRVLRRRFRIEDD